MLCLGRYDNIYIDHGLFQEFIPFILKWAAGVVQRNGETVEALFEWLSGRGKIYP